MSEPRYSFTQPICAACYDERYPGRLPASIAPPYRESEQCCDCAAETQDGIYFRVDPSTVRHPSREKDAA